MLLVVILLEVVMLGWTTKSMLGPENGSCYGELIEICFAFAHGCKGALVA